MKTRLNLKAGYILNYSLLNYLKGDITRTTRIKNLYTQIGICFTHDELRGLSSYLLQGEIRTYFDA